MGVKARGRFSRSAPSSWTCCSRPRTLEVSAAMTYWIATSPPTSASRWVACPLMSIRRRRPIWSSSPIRSEIFEAISPLICVEVLPTESSCRSDFTGSCPTFAAAGAYSSFSCCTAAASMPSKRSSSATTNCGTVSSRCLWKSANCSCTSVSTILAESFVSRRISSFACRSLYSVCSSLVATVCLSCSSSASRRLVPARESCSFVMSSCWPPWFSRKNASCRELSASFCRRSSRSPRTAPHSPSSNTCRRAWRPSTWERASSSSPRRWAVSRWAHRALSCEDRAVSTRRSS